MTKKKEKIMAENNFYKGMRLEGSKLLAYWGDQLDLSKWHEYPDDIFNFLIEQRMRDSSTLTPEMESDLTAFNELLKTNKDTRELFFNVRRSFEGLGIKNLEMLVVDVIKRSGQWELK